MTIIHAAPVVTAQGWTSLPALTTLVVLLLALATLLVFLLSRDLRHRQHTDSTHGRRGGASPRALDAGTGNQGPEGAGPMEGQTRRDRPAMEQEPLPSAEEAEAMEATDPRAASACWSRLARWDRVARCHEQLGQPLEAARIWFTLGRETEAEAQLRASLQSAPADEEARNLLVALLLDTRRRDEALELLDSVRDPDSPVRVSASFFENAGRHFEAANHAELALELYQKAHQLDDTLPELNQRLLFLRQIRRLQREAASGGNATPGSEPRELLERYIQDSSPQVDVRKVAPGEAPATSTAPLELAGHEIIVGHLALGCQNTEPPHSVRSHFALSRRYRIGRLISESPAGAVFEATDQLLDFAVALKLHRLPALSEEDYHILLERLRAITQLNHPNLAKLTFADRDRSILRLATEYLPGGNLRDFLQKLGGVGLPLLVRMAMHLASALHTAHLRGIPHGDLRPENILIGPDQRLKVVDFAVAPIPIARIDFGRQPLSESIDTPRIADLLGGSAGIQSDLVQMGDVMEFMLENSRRTVDPVVDRNSVDPLEELREVVLRLRNGSFTSVLRLWQVLEQIFERAMQATSATETHRSKP